MAARTQSKHYTIISADTHAGANHETYREYLDPAFHEDFDAWRGKYKNPWKDLRDTEQSRDAFARKFVPVVREFMLQNLKIELPVEPSK